MHVHDDHDRSSQEEGSAVALVGLFGALVIVATLLLSGLAARVADRAHAQTAADAAALAGVADGSAAAASVAAANGASLVQFADRGNEVDVEVVTPSGSRAIASAERHIEGFGDG